VNPDYHYNQCNYLFFSFAFTRNFLYHTGGVRLARPVSLQRTERGSRGSMQASGVFPSLEMLDTVVEERSDECEITAFEVTSTPDS
jgi:hypothetical protein